jgi:hypothetical protein
MNHALPFFLPKWITSRRLDKVIARISDRYGTFEYVLVRSSLLLPLNGKTPFPCTEEMSVLCAVIAQCTMERPDLSLPLMRVWALLEECRTRRSHHLPKYETYFTVIQSIGV